MIKTGILLNGGPLDGRMAEIQIANEFTIGMLIILENCVYEVCDGPAAQYIQKMQKGNEYLMIRGKFISSSEIKSSEVEEN